MYNPSRGGVRGGADQFTWESVKADKHRENYLGHSLMAPVGRWQKGKDLSWYAKERKGNEQALEMADKFELASIKKAEEEAMLIALGHNIVKKSQTLTKEDMREALKRSTDRDDHHIERIDGVGATSHRIASLSGVRKDARQNNEGVAFETVRERNVCEANNNNQRDDMFEERKKNKKKSKKHKKEKKHKKHHKESHNSDLSDDSYKYKTKYKNSELDDGNEKSLKHSKKSKLRHDSDSDASDWDDRKNSKLKNHKTSKPSGRHCDDFDSSDSENRKSLKVESRKKTEIKHQDYSSDSDSLADVVQHRTKHKKSQSDIKKSSKEKIPKKSKHQDYSSDDKSQSDSRKSERKRHKKQKEPVKRRRHDTSESD